VILSAVDCSGVRPASRLASLEVCLYTILFCFFSSLSLRAFKEFLFTGICGGWKII
jgi:hypothetical protein